MNAMMSGINTSDSYEHSARRHQEIEFTLAAVANAIASGKLPPADACAWARIAACEAKALGVSEPWQIPTAQAMAMAMAAEAPVALP